MAICKICGKEFRRSVKLRNYCSNECKEQSQYTDGNTCIIRGKPAKNKTATCNCKDCRIAYNKIVQNRSEVINRIKQTKLEHFGDPNYNGIEKTKKTNKEKYGSEYVFTSEHGKRKIEETSLRRYGCKDPRSSKECQQHREETIAKTGISGRFHTKEWNDAMEAKYGTTIPYQVKEIRDKGIETLRKNFNNEDIISPIQIPEIKEKIENTNIERYGNKCTMLNDEVRKKVIRKHLYDGISFDSKAEIEFYKYAKSCGFDVEREPIKIPYTDSKGIAHFYYPDFRVNGKLYEIKGDYLLNEDGYLRCPFKWRNEEYDEKLRAKTECMRQNDVILVLTSDIDKKIFPKL
jgi:hypothetical protein